MALNEVESCLNRRQSLTEHVGGPGSLSNFKSGRWQDFENDGPQLGLARVRFKVGVVDHLVGSMVQINGQNTSGTDEVQRFGFRLVFPVLLVDKVDEVDHVGNWSKLDRCPNFTSGFSDPKISGRDKKGNDEKFGKPSPT